RRRHTSFDCDWSSDVCSSDLASVSAQVAAPRVSIVVVAHSVRGELERCFESIDRHAGVPVETILVDNASTDGTQEWVKREHPERSEERRVGKGGVCGWWWRW